MVITIISAYTWFNKGDAAILLGTLTELNEFFGEDKVSYNILTFTPHVDEAKYMEIVPNVKNVTSNVFNPYPLKKTKVNKAIAIGKLGVQYLGLKTRQLISRNTLMGMKSVKLCSESDLIIVCGGGFLGGNKYNSLIHLAQIDILKFLKKPMILWGTSIEPPRKKLLKKITESVLRDLDIILPREKITEKYLNDWYEKDRIVPTPDLAFKTLNITKNSRIDKKFREIKIIAQGKKIIGITMREWFFPKSNDPILDSNKYEESLVKLIDKLGNEYLFVFIPQVIMDGDDDRIFADMVKEKIIKKENLLVLKDDYSPYELKYLISLFDQFLGTRMHSNIFSATVGKAPIAIAYEKKTNGIMEILNLSEYVIDIEKVNVEILENLIIKNRNDSANLAERTRNNVGFLKADIRKATEQVFSKVNI